MRATDRSPRFLAWVIVGICLMVLAGAAGVEWVFRPSPPRLVVTGTVQVTEVSSAAGGGLISEFNGFGGSPLPLQTGKAAFVTVTWHSDRSLPPGCQAQIAMHAPSDWRLFDWTGKPSVIGGTINAWQIAMKQHPELVDYDHGAITLTSASGQAIVVWTLSQNSLPDATLVRARVVTACKNQTAIADVSLISK